MYKIYISGPMTGLPKHNFPAFSKATKKLRKLGYKVISPAELDKGKKQLTWNKCLRRDLIQVVKVDAIATLLGWKDSKGANLEVYVGKELNMPIHTVSYYIDNKKELIG